VAGFQALTVSKVERLTEDSVAVTFHVPVERQQEFAFSAGQCVTLRRVVDGVEQRRNYSICAPVGGPVRIGVRAIPDGLFSQWLTQRIRPGAVIDVQRPSGTFRADPEAGGRHLCIAAGSGITPMLSVASTVLRHPESRVTLLYGNRTASSVMFAEELADLKNRYTDRFDLKHVLSREPQDVELLSGRLDRDRLRALLTAFVPVQALDHVWLCGPLGMVAGASQALDELGVSRDKIHVELFFVDDPPPELRRKEELVEGVTSDVTVVLDGRSTTSPMSRGKSILDSAQDTRTGLPFACKGGVCGTCRAQVTTGEVDMRRNYALEAEEVAAGFILTCQSYPMSDTVTVRFDA
jgi:ring-1,2-phenylacetyl-CoA epoxidase subunit PaaE